MFIYLFLLAAITTLSELPTNDNEIKELQELVAIFTDTENEETTLEDAAAVNVIVTTPITITNAIEPDMLKYKHWTGTYSPETFTLIINGTEVAQGAQHTLPAETKTVDIQFSYSFMKGMRTGTKTVTYQLNENITQANITFSWKDDWKVLVDNGTALKEVTA
ncbi:MAG TPA: hypothetical protein VKR54_00385 [Candidatus Babeliales bacterium]|jgi:hypothetical protein|nr:hypothetical protein [Candidatus Babeliales bacterium]